MGNLGLKLSLAEQPGTQAKKSMVEQPGTWAEIPSWDTWDPSLCP